MRLSLIYTPIVAFIFTACFQSSTWTKGDIEKKLKEVFPGAGAVRVVKGDDIGEDTFKMPQPVYKALVSEDGFPHESFLFYFYNVAEIDTAVLNPIMKTAITVNLRAGLGNTKPQFIFSLPQFTNRGNMLMVYAVSLELPETYDLRTREKKIAEVFGLSETKLKDVKVSETPNK